jgi:hypothetical protein
MPIKKHFLRLGAAGNGAHGVAVSCDACRRRRGPHAQTREEAAAAARREGFTAIKHREAGRDELLWICRRCFEAWPVRLRVTDFIAQNRGRKGGGQ